ncbi:MAG: RNA methyltransferase [Actinobacteria bacterium]|nr:MAG: RNA methyltransferase [Actinomycetota bacterium]
MAFDETLAERIRDHLASKPDIEEKKMFGGIAFMASGKMAVGVSGDSLMARVGAEQYEQALAEPGVGEFGKTGSPMTGWVLVDAMTIANDETLRHWIDRCVGFARDLET